MNEDPYSQEDQYSSDISDHSISTPMNNVLNALHNEEKEQSIGNSSKAEKVIL
jgi:hypothetical protein